MQGGQRPRMCGREHASYGVRDGIPARPEGSAWSGAARQRRYGVGNFWEDEPGAAREVESESSDRPRAVLISSNLMDARDGTVGGSANLDQQDALLHAWAWDSGHQVHSAHRLSGTHMEVSDAIARILESGSGFDFEVVALAGFDALNGHPDDVDMLVTAAQWGALQLLAITEQGTSEIVLHTLAPARRIA